MRPAGRTITSLFGQGAGEVGEKKCRVLSAPADESINFSGSSLGSARWSLTRAFDVQ
jgi:hypothetical protein